jgi:hypothetical protein
MALCDVVQRRGLRVAVNHRRRALERIEVVRGEDARVDDRRDAWGLVSGSRHPLLS